MLNKLFCRKGIALMAAYLVIIVLTTFVLAFLSVAISQNSSANTLKKREQAFNLAEAGLDRAVNWMRVQVTQPIIGNNTNPWNSGNAVTINLGGGASGTYSVTIVDNGQVGSNPNVHKYTITSIGTASSTAVTLINKVQNDDYARYVWFTNGETYNNNEVWFSNGDQLTGPTQTNSHFNIYHNPSFDGVYDQIYSADNYIRFFNNDVNNHLNLSSDYNGTIDVPTFTPGITLGVNPTTMPAQALNLRSASLVSGQGLRLTGATTILLKSTGSPPVGKMDITNTSYYDAHCTGYHCNTCSSNCTLTNISLPTNGALFVDSGALTLSGTLKGRLTIGSCSDITIADNIFYVNKDPGTSTDMLGIIAEGNIKIPKNLNTTGANPNNLEIDASVMALNTSFLLNGYADSDTAAKGTLTVFGGIIQKNRGPVGTFNSTTGTKITGYTKNYAYDSRMFATTPPFYPTTGDYISLSWEEKK